MGPTHPYPEGHLHVLAPPDLHLIVVGADVLEVGPGDGKEATGEGRGPTGEAERGQNRVKIKIEKQESQFWGDHGPPGGCEHFAAVSPPSPCPIQLCPRCGGFSRRAKPGCQEGTEAAVAA